MVSLLPIFGNLEKKVGLMQRGRFDDLDVVKQKSNTRGKRVILDQPNARGGLASVALYLPSFQ